MLCKDFLLKYIAKKTEVFRTCHCTVMIEIPTLIGITHTIDYQWVIE